MRNFFFTSFINKYSSTALVLWMFFPLISFSQLKIATISFKGNTVFSSAQILQQFTLHPNDTLRQELLEQDIHQLISRYENIGYPFAQVSVANIEEVQVQSEQKLNIVLEIQEGAIIHVNEIRASGNKETDTQVIIRESGITRGEVYSEERLSKVKSKLNKLDIFSSVGNPELTVNDSGGVITIPVEESATTTFDGVLGYNPAVNGNEGYFTGLVLVAFRNLFGTARKLNVAWKRESGDVSEIGVRYKEPWLFNQPLNAILGFNQRQQDSSFVVRNFDIQLDARVMDDLSVGLLFAQENIIPSSNSIGARLFDTRTSTIGFEVNYDTRDDIVSPTSGVLFKSNYHTGKKTSSSTFQSETKSTIERLGLDFAFVVQPFQRQVISTELHGRELLTDNIGIGEMFRLGGTTTLRGFKESQFIGSKIAWTNVEYRFLLSRRSFFFGFFDTGYYFIPENPGQAIVSSQEYTYGYGVGIKLETAIGIVGVNIALGEGDSFSQAKLHFGLFNEF